MSVYYGEEGIKKLIYDERKAFVDQMWQRYKDTTNKNGEAGDYRILAEICEKLPFFENSDVGQEISRLLNKHYKGATGYYQAQKHHCFLNVCGRPQTLTIHISICIHSFFLSLTHKKSLSVTILHPQNTPFFSLSSRPPYSNTHALSIMSTHTHTEKSISSPTHVSTFRVFRVID